MNHEKVSGKFLEALYCELDDQAVQQEPHRKGGEVMEQISFHDLPGAAQRRLVHGTLSGVKRFFSDPAQWEAYAAWHVKRYGRPPERGFGCPESKV